MFMHNITPSGLAADLEQRASTGRPIRVGLIGSGEMGTDIVTQVRQMHGLAIGAIADLRVDAACAAVRVANGADSGYRVVETESALTQAIEAGDIAITEDAQLVCTSGLIDVVIDATGKPASRDDERRSRRDDRRLSAARGATAWRRVLAWRRRRTELDDRADPVRQRTRLSGRRRGQGQEQSAQYRRNA
jgi:hypothetical protein